MENEWAPPDHPVFTLVPPEFDYHARNLYTLLDCPPVSHGSFLLTFRRLRDAFMPDIARQPLQRYIASHDRNHNREYDIVDILPGQQNLRLGQELGENPGIGDLEEDDIVPSFMPQPL